MSIMMGILQVWTPLYSVRKHATAKMDFLKNTLSNTQGNIWGWSSDPSRSFLSFLCMDDKKASAYGSVCEPESHYTQPDFGGT